MDGRASKLSQDSLCGGGEGNRVGGLGQGKATDLKRQKTKPVDIDHKLFV